MSNLVSRTAPIGWLVDEAHRTTGSYRLSIYFYRSLECQPTPRWWGCHQAGGVLGQGGSEGESAVGSKLALTRARVVSIHRIAEKGYSRKRKYCTRYVSLRQGRRRLLYLPS